MFTMKFVKENGDFTGVECIEYEVKHSEDGTVSVDYLTPTGESVSRQVRSKTFIENALGKTIAVVNPNRETLR